MNTNERTDIIAFDTLTTHVDLQELSFNTVLNLITTFTHTILLNDESLAEPFIRQQVTRNFTSQAIKFIQRKITVETLEQCRVQAWQLHDEWSGDKKKLMRVVVCCLYDKDAAEFSTYGPETILETFFSVLFELKEEYCHDFTRYAVQSLTKK